MSIARDFRGGRLLAPGFLLLMLAASAVAGSFVEDFTSVLHADTLATTASWDTSAGLLRLPPYQPVLVGSYDTPTSCIGAVVDGNKAYLAAHSGGLVILDIADVSAPVYLGSYDTPGTTRGVAVDGHLAFLADDANGLVIVDVTDPAAPAFVGGYNTPGVARFVVVDGNAAFVADDASLQIIDITDPSNPTLAGSLPAVGGARQVRVDGDLAFICDNGNQLTVVDVSDFAAPSVLGIYAAGAPVRGVAVDGDLAFVANYSSGLAIVNLRFPDSPSYVGGIDTPGLAIDVSVAGDYAYVVDYDHGIQVVDVSDPANPRIAGHWETPSYAYTVVLDGRDAFVSDFDGGLRIVQVANEIDPVKIGGYASLGTVAKIVVAGDHAYVPSYGEGLTVFDVSDPSDPTPIEDLLVFGTIVSMDRKGDRLFVLIHRSGDADQLGCIDITNPAHVVLRSTVDLPVLDFSLAYDIEVSGDYAYVTVDPGIYTSYYPTGLFVYDVSDPQAPAFVDSVLTPGDAMGLDVEGDVAYVANFERGLRVIDLSDPTNLVLGPELALSDSVWDVVVAGDHAYLSTNRGRLKVADVSDPWNPAIAGGLSTGGWNLSLDGNRLYGTGSYDAPSVRRIDVTDPTEPVLVDSFVVTGPALWTTPAGDYLFVAENVPGGFEIAAVSQRAYSESPAIGQSIALPGVEEVIETVRLKTIEAGSVEWYVSADSGAHWESALPDSSPTALAHPGSRLLWRAVLDVSTDVDLPVVDRLNLTWGGPQSGIDSDASIPAKHALHAGRPNPFRAGTTIVFDLPRAESARLAVYDVRGRLVVTLLDDRVAPGFHRREWNGLGRDGRRLSSGVYFVRLETESFAATRKVVLLE